VFVWVCLQPDRHSGILPVTSNDLARALGKTGDEVPSCLEELERTGMCRRRDPDQIEIRDQFWPYERSLSMPQCDDLEVYVATVRQIFLRQGCVRSRFTPAGDRLAAEWNPQGIPVERLQRAFLLGTLRKYVPHGLRRAGGQREGDGISSERLCSQGLVRSPAAVQRRIPASPCVQTRRCWRQ
jgi:hypothetical protein